MDKDRNINMLIELSIDTYSYNMAMKRVMLSLPEEMVKVLDKERKEKYLESIPETVRVILWLLEEKGKYQFKVIPPKKDKLVTVRKEVRGRKPIQFIQLLKKELMI